MKYTQRSQYWSILCQHTSARHWITTSKKNVPVHEMCRWHSCCQSPAGRAAEEVSRRKCRYCLTPPIMTKQSNLILCSSDLYFGVFYPGARKFFHIFIFYTLQLFGKEVSGRKCLDCLRPTTEQSTAIFFRVAPLHRISETAQTCCICLFPQLKRLTTLIMRKHYGATHNFSTSINTISVQSHCSWDNLVVENNSKISDKDLWWFRGVWPPFALVTHCMGCGEE